jgi:hypothetical protein
MGRNPSPLGNQDEVLETGNRSSTCTVTGGNDWDSYSVHSHQRSILLARFASCGLFVLCNRPQNKTRSGLQDGEVVGILETNKRFNIAKRKGGKEKFGET